LLVRRRRRRAGDERQQVRDLAVPLVDPPRLEDASPARRSTIREQVHAPAGGGDPLDLGRRLERDANRQEPWGSGVSVRLDRRRHVEARG
jgi:hypothetical protein